MEEEPQDSRSAFAACLPPYHGIIADVPSLQRQFSRIVEMLILRGLQPDDSKLNRGYRLQVRVDLEGSRLSSLTRAFHRSRKGYSGSTM